MMKDHLRDSSDASSVWKMCVPAHRRQTRRDNDERQSEADLWKESCRDIGGSDPPSPSHFIHETALSAYRRHVCLLLPRLSSSWLATQECLLSEAVQSFLPYPRCHAVASCVNRSMCCVRRRHPRSCLAGVASLWLPRSFSVCKMCLALSSSLSLLSGRSVRAHASKPERLRTRCAEERVQSTERRGALWLGLCSMTRTGTAHAC